MGEEEEAIERAWERIFAEGSYGTEIRELDDDAPNVEPYVKPLSLG